MYFAQKYKVSSMYSRLRYFLVFILVVFLSACGKKDNPVPVTELNYKVIAVESDPRYVSLRTIGGSAILVTGNICAGYNCNGVVLYRQKNDGAVDDFVAFDRTCTNEARDCAMEIDKHFPDLLVCPKCGSVFNMSGRYMEEGPAMYPLREFSCDFYNGDLRIY